MRIIHTADWHIGKIVNEVSMIEDQKYILNKLIELIDKEAPEVLIIAGDIYDRSIPPVEGVELLNETINKILIDKKVKIMAISGNHDSSERLSFGGKVLQNEGLYINGYVGEEIKPIKLMDGDKNINFYLVPYVDPAILRARYNNPEIKNHNDVMKEIIKRINTNLNKSEINILITHGYVTNISKESLSNAENIYELAHLEVSDSERPLSIGGTDLIEGSLFDDFDYVALGHLHGRQKVGREEIRYSGSLLKYSFSEVKQRKGVVLIDINKNGEIKCNNIELKPRRDMRIIKGQLDALVKIGEGDENNEDYIEAILTDSEELYNPMDKLRTVYPNAMILKRENKRNIGSSISSASGDFKSKSELDLFKEFYNSMGNGEFTNEREEVINDVIKEVIKRGEI